MKAFFINDVKHLLKIIPTQDGVTKQPLWSVSCACGWHSWEDPTIPCDLVGQHGQRKMVSEEGARKVAEIHALRVIPQHWANCTNWETGFDLVVTDTGAMSDQQLGIKSRQSEGNSGVE